MKVFKILSIALVLGLSFSGSQGFGAGLNDISREEFVLIASRLSDQQDFDNLALVSASLLRHSLNPLGREVRASLNYRVKSTVGAQFTRRLDLERKNPPISGEIWEDPQGVIWYPPIQLQAMRPNVGYQDQVKECELRGLTLSTKEQYISLARAMGAELTEAPGGDLTQPLPGYVPQILPGFQDGADEANLTATSEYDELAWVFYVQRGFVFNQHHGNFYFRCVNFR